MTLDYTQPTKSKLPQNWITKWLIGLLMLSSLTGGGYFIYRQITSASNKEASSQMQTVAARRETLPITISANGTIEAKQSTNVSPKSSGRLKRLLVDEGDY